jgi:hypothetical protein
MIVDRLTETGDEVVGLGSGVVTNDMAGTGMGTGAMRKAKCEERKCERVREVKVIHKLKIASYTLDMHSLASLVICFKNATNYFRSRRCEQQTVREPSCKRLVNLINWSQNFGRPQDKRPSSSVGSSHLLSGGSLGSLHY